MVHYTWIAQADRATRTEGFDAVITGRRDQNGYAAMEFSTVVLDRTPTDLESLAQTLDRTLTKSAAGYWNSAETAVRPGAIDLPEEPAPIVLWVRDAAQRPPVWIGRDRGELVGLITELDSGEFEAYRSGASPATYPDLAAAQAHRSPAA